MPQALAFTLLASVCLARGTEPAAQPISAELTPISAALRLADISCTTPTDRFNSVEVQITVAGTPDAMHIPMHREDANGTSHWTARIMTRTPTFSYVVDGIKDHGDSASHTLSQQYQATIEPDHPTPDWAKGAVWYQIFPERFRNGNPANDPHGPGVFLAPWNSDWYQVQPGELEARAAREGKDPDKRKRGGGDLYKVIFDRRYGGDLQGVVQELDYLLDLGVTAIYLNPIFQARSLHKYDASDFRHIDSALGNPPDAGPSLPIDDTYYTPPKGETGDPATWTWTPADRYFIDVFLPECKKRHIRVILDGVFNHTGKEFWAFEDILKNGRSSPYADWYRDTFDNSGKLATWKGWDGPNGYLPVFREVKGSGRDWDTTVDKGDMNPGVKEHLFAITKRWMDPNNDGDPSDGIDGWRLDVVPDVGMPFWKSWREEVKSINPDAILVCEVWHDADDFFPEKGGAFDTQMHYPFAFPVLDWLTNTHPGKHGIEPFTSQQLKSALVPAFDNAPQTNLIHQNLFASHDTDRYASMLFNPGRSGYDRDNNIQGGAKIYKQGKPDAHALQLSLLGMAIQATYLGSPMIYYGDEVGMWGADDPTSRKPMPWPDLGEPMNKDDARDESVRATYATWLNLRAHPVYGDVLKYGSVRPIDLPSASPEESSSVFAFERELNNRRVVVIVNRGETAVEVSSIFHFSGRSVKVPPLGAIAWGVSEDGAPTPLATLGAP